MYDTHRPITDHTDAYAVNQGINIDEESCEDGESDAEWAYADESGQTFLTNPKKKSKGGIPWIGGSCATWFSSSLPKLPPSRPR